MDPARCIYFLMCIYKNSGYQRGRHEFVMEGGADNEKGRKEEKEKGENATIL